uniref:Mating pair formation protein TrbH n=1 Tax=Achromobacter xylosoxidans (strain A8) TaxID=762376 RepID=Q5GRE8_ACHXA|nr:lipoprotein [Achromobacter xylosoxidans]CAI47820.1 mating pair formation protein TrbH [Achromobacter xylosoxidans A8]
MRKIIFAALFVLALGGCATTGQYGNFVPPTATVDQQQLAREAWQQLAVLYPPAKTRLELQQATPDAFGQALVLTLRERGYALLEFNPASAKAQATAANEPASPAALPLRYVLDQAGDSNLYRLTLLVGHQSITRPYLVQDGSFAPAGYWVRKE